MLSIARCLAVVLTALAVGTESSVAAAMPSQASYVVDDADDAPDSILGVVGTRAISSSERRHILYRSELPLAAETTALSAAACAIRGDRNLCSDAPRQRPALHTYDATAPPQTQPT